MPAGVVALARSGACMHARRVVAMATAALDPRKPRAYLLSPLGIGYLIYSSTPTSVHHGWRRAQLTAGGALTLISTWLKQSSYNPYFL
jgi:hypothetical protein